MENANETVRRRVSRILDHVAASAASDEAFQPFPHLFPMNCSSTLNNMMQRRDNRLLFARQGSISRARFMQQVSISQDPAGPDSSSQHVLSDCFCSGESPLFSRKAKADSTAPTARIDSVALKQDTLFSPNDAPMFAIENSGKFGKQQVTCSRRRQSVNGSLDIFSFNLRMKKHNAGMEWSPRMDVAESGPKYVVTVELPGVRTTDIQVEVEDESLTIMGKRLVSQWRVANGCGTPKPTYHQREILEGPYRVVWPLPKNVNMDGASAELLDGFLRITLPKL